jgi:diguanylate cyclase (GGDEF)-like protein
MPPDDQLLLAVLALAIVANVLVLATFLPARGRRRSMAHESPAVSIPPGDGDARTVAAIEAFVAEVAADAAGGIRPPSPLEVMARRREVLAGAVDVPRAGPPASEPHKAATAQAPVPSRPTSASVAALAGLADRATWDRAVREESARTARFGRPVTVVMAELPNIDDLADHLGREVADRVVVETARLLSSEGRAVDRIAWLGAARFGVLLLETEETRAPGYVDRVRAAADDWLQSAGLTIRLSLGWASPAVGRDVLGAATLARQRMDDAGRASRAGGIRRDAPRLTHPARR